MPNWTQNRILIPVNKKADFIRKFTVGIKHGKSPRLRQFDFNRVLRQPNDLLQGDLTTQQILENPHNWNTWNRNNWGSKWSACDSDYKLHTSGEFEGLFEIIFTTANGYASQALVSKICERLKCEVQHIFYSEEDDVAGWDAYEFNRDECKIYIAEESDSGELRERLKELFGCWGYEDVEESEDTKET